MENSILKEEYLKKYLTKSEVKQKKKKKLKKEAKKRMGLKVYMEDAFVPVDRALSASSNSDSDNVVEIKKVTHTFKRTFQSSEELSMPSRRHDSDSEASTSGLLPDVKEEVKFIELSNKGHSGEKSHLLKTEDHSSSRTSKHSSRKMDKIPPKDDFSLRRRTKPVVEKDLSPPRKSIEISPKKDPSLSRRKRPTLEDDLSPPRKSNKVSSKRDLSPARRKRSTSQDDLSPLRKSNKVSSKRDLSPARRKRSTSQDDLSPLRKSNKVSSKRNLPSPRGTRPNLREDLSPPRKLSKISSKIDPSPARQERNISLHEHSSRGKHRISPRRDTYPYRSGKTHFHDEISSKYSKGSPQLESGIAIKIEKPSNGAKFDVLSGSVDTKVLDPRIPVRRRKLVGKNRETLEDKEKKEREEEKQKELNEKYEKWNKGVFQIKDRAEKLSEMRKVINEDFARYADDESMNAHLKSLVYNEDPMLKHVAKKKEKKEMKSGTVLPKYKGSWPSNRFQIAPGYRWDGVNRTNGFEEKIAATKNRKSAQETQYYEQLMTYEV